MKTHTKYCFAWLWAVTWLWLSVVPITSARHTREANIHPGLLLAPVDDFAAIDAYLKAEMQTLRLPGLALGIVQGDQIVHLTGLGVADPAGRPVTPQTPFILASVSKSFTALGIMQLVEAAKIDLDAPVQRYLPWFRVADVRASAAMTVRDLMHHTSGLPEQASLAYMLDQDMRDDALEARVRALGSVQLRQPVGAVFEYTDANYDVLGLIIQTVAGQSYETYVHQHIFTPLAMAHSYTAPQDAVPRGLATGHRAWFGLSVPFDAPYSRASLPSSYLIASAEDMTHFLTAQLNAGQYAGVSVLSPSGIAAMHRPAVRQGVRDIFYGMGWETRTVNGIPVVQHDGVNSNFYADMILDPAGRWGVVILTNFNTIILNGGRLQALSSGVMSLLHGQAPPAVPMPHHPLFAPAMFSIASVSVLLALGILHSAATLWRWWVTPAQRPHAMRGYLTGIGLPFVGYTTWGLLMLVGFPQVAYPLPFTMLVTPDLGYLVVVSGVVALTWGVLYTLAAVWLVLQRGQPSPLGASINISGETSA